MYSIDGSLGRNGFNRLRRCYERRNVVIDAFFDLANAIITVRNLIRRAWTTAGTPDPHDDHETAPIYATSYYRWEGRPRRRP